MQKMKVAKRIIVCLSMITILCTTSVRTYADNKDEADVQSVESNSSDLSSISIDGYFDDWEDKPISSLYWNDNNGNAYHDVSLIKDEEYIYVFVQLHQSINSTTHISDINLIINNQDCPINISDSTGNDINIKNNSVETGLYLYTGSSVLGTGAVSTEEKKGQTDEMEVKISISALEAALGLPAGTINNGSAINFSMDGGSVELVGTSTGAETGVLLCIATVIFVIWRRGKKVRFAQ